MHGEKLLHLTPSLSTPTDTSTWSAYLDQSLVEPLALNDQLLGNPEKWENDIPS